MPLFSVCCWLIRTLFLLGSSFALHIPRSVERDSDVILGYGSVQTEDSSRDIRDTRVSYKECLVDEGGRLDCGMHGITQDQCAQRGCCWGSSRTTGVPWCYHSLSAMKPGCLMKTEEKVECGWYGIKKHQCMDMGCCWQPSADGAPWCYQTLRVPVHQGDCGVPSIPPRVRSRIVGGVEATPHSWPWMVSLTSDGEHFCGGSLINNQWVVSAAHCEPAFMWGDSRKVVLGMHSLSSRDDPKIEVQLEEIISHEDYSSVGDYDHDIMLLKLAEPVTFNDMISPVCLPAPSDTFHEGRRCYTTGWGHTQSGGSSPDRLQQVMVPLISTDTCNQPGWYGGEVDDTMICAGYIEGGRDSCQGDSGGPLVCNEDGRWVLVGIVSWGEGCARENKPGIYSRVTRLVEWMEKTVAQHS